MTELSSVNMSNRIFGHFPREFIKYRDFSIGQVQVLHIYIPIRGIRGLEVWPRRRPSFYAESISYYLIFSSI